jgi:hypothetical protein
MTGKFQKLTVILSVIYHHHHILLGLVQEPLGAKVSTHEEDHERQHLVAGRSFLWNFTPMDQT